MSMQNKKVYVAMSGGVDSSVAAALLKEAGYVVTGIHILSWDACQNNEEKQDAMRVAAVLDIPFEVWDFRKEYRMAVFDYMVREYRAGRTPNPDVMCNKEIKFGIFLESALGAGADYIATGHYTRLKHFNLLAAKDLNKDQSYFLWTLTQKQLAHCLFPIGDYLKSEVRELARKFHLPTSEKKDSQGLCFVGNIDFGEFLRGAIPAKPGLAMTTDGKAIGQHHGAEFYTIGQRHGLGIGGGSREPLYVVQKNVETNTIVLARGLEDPALYRQELFARNVHWIGKAPSLPLQCQARIRYRQQLQLVTLNTSPPNPLSLPRRGGEKRDLYPVFDIEIKGSDGEIRVIFEKPQRAVAPGQSIVFYNGSEMLGGGVIE